MKKKVLLLETAILLSMSIVAGCGFSIGEEKPVASVSWNNKDGFSTENYLDDDKEKAEDKEENKKEKPEKKSLVGNDDSALPPAGSEKTVELPDTGITFGTLMGTEPTLDGGYVFYYLDDDTMVQYVSTPIPVGDQDSAGELYDTLPGELENSIGATVETIDIGWYDLDDKDFYAGIFRAKKDGKGLGIYACLQDVGIDNYILFTVYDGAYSGEDDATNMCFNIADEFPGKVGKTSSKQSAKEDLFDSDNTSSSDLDEVSVIDPAGTISGGGVVTLKIGKESLDLPEVLSTPKGDYEMTTGKDYYVSYRKGNTFVSYSDSYVAVGDESSANDWMKAYTSADVMTDEFTLNGKKAFVVRVPYSSGAKQIHILQDIGAKNYIHINVDTTDSEFSDKEVLETFSLTLK